MFLDFFTKQNHLEEIGLSYYDIEYNENNPFVKVILFHVLTTCQRLRLLDFGRTTGIYLNCEETLMLLQLLANVKNLRMNCDIVTDFYLHRNFPLPQLHKTQDSLWLESFFYHPETAEEFGYRIHEDFHFIFLVQYHNLRHLELYFVSDDILQYIFRVQVTDLLFSIGRF